MHRTIIYLLLLSCFFISSSLYGQQIVEKADLPSRSQKQYKKVLALSRAGKSDKALSQLDKLLTKHPGFVTGRLRQAGILYKQKQLTESLAALDLAIALAPEHDPEMYYSKGTIHKELKQLELAAAAYDAYVERVPEGSRSDQARIAAAQAAFAAKAMANPVPYKPEVLPGAVNSPYSEYIPQLTIDGQQMIFTRRVRQQEDLYVADLVDGEFANVRQITELNTPYNEGVHTITADGQRIIFTASNRPKEMVGGSDLFTSRITADGWARPSNMGSVINTTAWDAQPSVSADGLTLYWSSSRNYGHGGRDIWTSTRTDSSGWNEPKPLSDAVNSQHNEESPFIHPDGKTLYFRSNRPVGMGGYDIYYSRYNDSLRTWMPAVNIGYPINTEDSEGAMSVSLDGTRAYFATDQSSDIDGDQKNLNIHTFELYPEARPQPVTYVKATVIDADTRQPLQATVQIKNHENKLTNRTVQTKTSGSYLGSVLAGYTYGFYVSSPGYMYRSEYIDLAEMRTSYEPYELTIALSRVVPTESEPVTIADEPSKPVVLQNVFFETGSATLSSTSDTELDELANTLLANEQIKVQIAGHTDNVGSTADNLLLSQQRAKSVVQALIQRGVAQSRLSAVGYGETQPIATNDSEAGRQQNRRTEFRIL